MKNDGDDQKLRNCETLILTPSKSEVAAAGGTALGAGNPEFYYPILNSLVYKIRLVVNLAYAQFESISNFGENVRRVHELQHNPAARPHESS